MQLTSPAFVNQGQIPEEYSCHGRGVPVPLQINDCPEKAQSLVLIIDDPDAPGRTYTHLILFNIDPKTNEISEQNWPKAANAINSSGQTNYVSPCPPSGTHRYYFKLYALDKKLDLFDKTSQNEVEKTMENHILAETVLMGTFTAP